MNVPPDTKTAEYDILVVEDSPLQAKRLKRVLEENGYRIKLAVNGEEGLAEVRRCEPLLIISDIVMPVMDGYQMCRALKNDEALRHIPVILLTSLTDPRDVFRGLQCGADSYISKPYETASLLTRIETVLENARLPGSDEISEDLEVFLAGEGYPIGSSRRQILNLLLSTYQDAVEKNQKLRETRAKLVTVNEKLEKLVSERTSALRREISERKRIEHALASEKERLSVTLRSIADGVITTNTEGKVVLMNRAAEDLTGWPQAEAVGTPITRVFNLRKTETQDGREEVVENILKSGGVFGLDDQITLRSRDNAERVVAVSGTPILDRTHKIIGVIFVFRDVTDQKRMEEELVRAQKLESLGVLAGGIAHDFNNLLTAILGNISLAKIDPGSDSKLSRLAAAEKACFRAKDLTQQLLTFSKGGTPIKKVMSLQRLLVDCARFAVRGSNVRCEFHIPEKLWPVEVDEGQISQVIHNLVINADQAMHNGGIIRIRAENLIFRPEDRPGIPLRRGKYVKVSVTDQGNGIHQAHLGKIFDPYFTTKEKGSGLGLATAYSILRNHGGTITVQSKLGTGSAFHAYLPAALDKSPVVPEIRDKVVEGSGTVLVMDDDKMLRDFVAELLDHLGYRVDLAADGRETIEAYRRAKEAGRPYDCVLLDLTVPGGMGGKETMRRLRQIDPHIRAIVSSGYSDDPVMADFKKYGFSAMVAKPYNAEQLSKVLNSVLSRAN